MKKKAKKIIKLLIIILVIFLILIGGYTSLILNTKLVIRRSTNRLLKNAYTSYATIKENKLLNKLNANSLNKRIIVDTKYEQNGNVDSEIELKTEIFNNLEIVTDLYKTKNKVITNSSLLYKNQDIFKLNTVIKDNKIYYGLPGILDNYLFKEKMVYKNINEFDKKEIIYFVNTTFNMLLNVSDKQNTYNKSEKILLDNKEISIIKHTLVISKQKQKDVLVEIYNRILQDKKYQEIVYKLLYADTTKEIFLQNIQNKLNNISNKVIDNDYVIEYYINPLTTQILKVDIKKTNANNIEKYEVYTNKTENRDFKIVHSLNNNDKEIYEIRAIDKENFVILYTDEYLKVTTKTTIKEDIKIQAESYLNNEFKEKIELRLYEDDKNIKGSLVFEKEKDHIFSINMTMVNRDENLTLKEDDLTNAVNIESLDERQSQEILSKIMQNLFKSKFGKEIFRLAFQSTLMNRM